MPGNSAVESIFAGFRGGKFNGAAACLGSCNVDLWGFAHMAHVMPTGVISGCDLASEGELGNAEVMLKDTIVAESEFNWLPGNGLKPGLVIGDVSGY